MFPQRFQKRTHHFGYSQVTCFNQMGFQHTNMVVTLGYQMFTSHIEKSMGPFLEPAKLRLLVSGMVCPFLRIPYAFPETNNQCAPENGWLLEDELSKLPIPSSLYGTYSPTGFRIRGKTRPFFQGTQQDSQWDEG